MNNPQNVMYCQSVRVLAGEVVRQPFSARFSIYIYLYLYLPLYVYQKMILLKSQVYDRGTPRNGAARYHLNCAMNSLSPWRFRSEHQTEPSKDNPNTFR